MSIKTGVGYTFNIGLVDVANRPYFKANPTLASGDFKISRNNGAFSNLSSLPAVSPAAGRIVKVLLNATEMTGSRITVQAVDAAGAEWDELLIHLMPDVVSLSDIWSSISDAGSNLQSMLLVMSGVLSDTYSLLSDLQSDFQSRVPKRVATDSQLSDMSSDLKSLMTAGVGLTVSAMSDVASQVWAHAVGTRVDSRILVIQSSVSDVYSMLSDHHSDFQSRVPKLVANNSQLSDLASDLRSFLVVMSGVQSDIYSAVSDMQSDFQSRVPKRVATDSQLSDLASDIRSAISETTVVRRNTAQAGAATTITLDASASATSELYTGELIVLVGGTGSGQTRLITAYNGGTKVATISPAWTTNPDATTVFVIEPFGQTEITASGLSDVASAVWAHAVGARVDSRLLLNESRISDTYSMLSDFYSDFQSRVPKLVANNSQLSDLASDLRSFLVVMSGVQSDVYSALSDFQSDFQSRVPKKVATDSQLSDVWSDLRSQIGGITASVSVSDISDIASAVWANTIGARVDSRILLNQSRISDTYSMVSDLLSDFQSRVPKKVATDSQLSDLASDIASDLKSFIGAGVPADASTMSDIRSAISAGPAATVTASDISDIASAVWANTIGARVDSRLLLNQSRISDTYSMVSDLLSDFQSRVPKRVATDSQLSDLQSDLRSFLVIMSGVQSDLYSLLSDHHSDFQSRVPKKVATDSQLSDVWSDLRSQIGGITASVSVSDISDIASAVWANTIGARVDSRILLNQSRISDTYSMVSDMLSDFQSRVPKRVATDSQLSDLASDLRSFLVVMSGVQSDVYSALSDFQSDFQSRVPKKVATDSQVSDLSSDLKSLLVAGVGLTVSAMSDVASQVWVHTVGARVDSRLLLTQSMASDVYSQVSDIRSQLIAGTFALGASNISDVASAVRVTVASDLSDILSAAVQINSRVLVNKSVVSDIYSLLQGGASLDASTMSDLRSAIAGGPAATVTASDISDIASAVRAAVVSDLSDILSAVQQANSRVLVTKSTVSDIYSLLGVGVPLDASTISDVRSAITAGGSGGGAGGGSIQVNHNYGGADNLAYKTSGGIGIDNAEIVAFLKSDYDAGNWEPAYEKGRTTTDVNGRWVQSLMLDAGTYVIRSARQLDFGPDTKTVVVV